MNNNLDMEMTAIENLDGDIESLTLQARFKKDTNLIKTIIKEKLNLLYSMEIINYQTFRTYHKAIKALEAEDQKK